MTYDDDFDVDTTGDYELSERQALRRVEGLSTELEDITEAEYRQVRLERVILVGVWTDGTAQDVERSMTELARLAETAGSNVLDAFVQRRDAPDASTFIGSGKVLELREAVVAHRADTVICDGDLTPSQLRTLEERLKVKVVDRTWLILDIFAQHARSKEGKARLVEVIDRYVTYQKVALAVRKISQEKGLIDINTGAASADLTGPACSATGAHWVYDTYALAHVTGEAMVKAGGDTWFFITADYAFGHALQRDVAGFVTAAGGKVLGSVRHPINNNDFSSFLLQAQNSKAKRAWAAMSTVSSNTTMPPWPSMPPADETSS